MYLWNGEYPRWKDFELKNEFDRIFVTDVRRKPSYRTDFGKAGYVIVD
jgi:hypothetical protein